MGSPHLFVDAAVRKVCNFSGSCLAFVPAPPRSGFVRCGNRTPNHAELDFPTNVSVVNPGSEPWTGPAGGALGQQGKTCPFRNIETQPRCDTFAGRTGEKCRMPAARPIHCLNNFPNPAQAAPEPTIRSEQGCTMLRVYACLTEQHDLRLVYPRRIDLRCRLLDIHKSFRSRQ